MLVLLALASIGATLLFWSRRRDGAIPALPAAQSTERSPLTLQIGDVVQHLHCDYLVDGALLLSEAPRAARLCHLVDGHKERFLFASTHAPDEVYLLAGVDPPDAQADRMHHTGVALALSRRWTAASLGVGKTGKRRFAAELQVFEYTAATQEFMLILVGIEDQSAFFGERLLPHTFEILPGS